MKFDDERWYPADERTSDAGQEGGDAGGLAAAIEIRIPGCQNWGCHLVASRESQWYFESWNHDVRSFSGRVKQPLRAEPLLVVMKGGG